VQSHHRGKRSKIAGLVAYAAFLAATVAWFALYQFPHAPSIEARQSPADAAGPVDRYAGAILLPGGANGGCRQVKFDNNTGSLVDGGAAPCRDSAPGANSTEGRMGAIRGAFSKQ
jgi:hypothetical protein